MSSGFCEVGAELTDKGTLCFLQFFECSRGLDSELCKHVVSYWSLRGKGRRGRTEEEEGRGERKGEEGGEGKREMDRRRSVVKTQARVQDSSY